MLDRFSQLEPMVFIHVDGYQYGGKPFDRRGEVKKILERLTSVKHVIQLCYLDTANPQRLTPDTMFWHELLDHPPVSREEFRYEEVGFNHPLWILFSSGTTGLPKPIMHSHGGIIIEQLKHVAFNFDMRARRAAVLLHHHRLDDVELPRQLAAVGRGSRALRRQPGLARWRPAVEDGAGREGEPVRREPDLPVHPREERRRAEGRSSISPASTR